jgi:hypothetical protein
MTDDLPSTPAERIVALLKRIEALERDRNEWREEAMKEAGVVVATEAKLAKAEKIADEVFDFFEAKGATSEAFGAAEVGARIRAEIEGGKTDG